MQHKTLVLMGQSGAGKGTQAELLTEYFKTNDPTTPVFYVETGARFREFIKNGGTHSSAIATEYMKQGLRQPDFLAIWNWADLLVRSLEENTHLIMDGVARSLPEAEILVTSFSFFKRADPTIIYIKVSDEWSIEHLLSRGRKDDLTRENIENKLKWFKSEVTPAIEFFKTYPNCRFVEINGEQSVEQVHQDILKAIT